MATSTELVRSMAKIEQCHKLHGSQRAEKPKDYNKVPEKGFEEKGAEVSALTFVSPLAYKVIIHLQEKRVTFDMIHNMDTNLRITRGIYMIKYHSKNDKDYKKGRPFTIGQDLIRMGIHVAGPRHFHYLCDRIPELNWLRHNTFYTDKLFDIAAMQTGIPIWFSIDWCGYAEKLASQPGPAFGSKQGPASTPYSVFKCSGEEYRKHYKDKCATLRVLNDVLREVQETEALPAVQREMLAATGESGVTRKDNVQPKDTKTGRFVSRKKEE